MSEEKNDIHIRTAVIEDSRIISFLLLQLGYELAEEKISEKIINFKQKYGHHVFVAEVDARVAGLASVHTIDWFHRLDSVARLSAIVVDDSYRGRGIGCSLIRFCEEIAVKEGCTTMELTSSQHRKSEGTYDFYNSLGYLEAGDQTSYFRKKLV